MSEHAVATLHGRPVPGPTRPYRFPAFDRSRLDNGITLLVAPVSKLPILSVTALLEAGCVCDPPKREGLDQLTARLLLEGTTTSDGAQLAERFERLGASIEAHADWDMAAVTMTVSGPTSWSPRLPSLPRCCARRRFQSARSNGSRASGAPNCCRSDRSLADWLTKGSFATCTRRPRDSRRRRAAMKHRSTPSAARILSRSTRSAPRQAA